MRDEFPADRERRDDIEAERQHLARDEPADDPALMEREVPISEHHGRQADDQAAPLIDEHEKEELRLRWKEIQTGFVDEPKRAVAEADLLVADAIARLSESFASARSTLERSWDKGGDDSTEDLRRVLRRYRAFFGRLLQL